jgi:hypothetical protein
MLSQQGLVRSNHKNKTKVVSQEMPVFTGMTLQNNP